MTRHGLSGYTIIRNAIKGDYCIKECIESMLPICDEVVVADSESDDGTTEMLSELTTKHATLRIVSLPWKQEVNDPKWFVKWINTARSHLRFNTQLMLDADEVLSADCYPTMRSFIGTESSLWFERLNFWRNGSTIIPKGETCGYEVVRFGPTRLFMPSDEPYGTEFHPEPEPMIRQMAHRLSPLPVIFHYGFIRKTSGMIEKSKINLQAFFGTWDVRLSRLALHPDQPWNAFFKHKKPYQIYSGAHPEHCKVWLKERGAL